jgi:hypothetical protein
MPRKVSDRGLHMVEDVVLPMLQKYNYDVKTAVLHTSCLPVFFLVTEWPPVACKLYPSGRQSHANCNRVAASRCKFRPILFMLHVTGGHADTIYMQLAASRMQTLHALAATCV